MANVCLFNMHVRGERKALDEFLQVMDNTDYSIKMPAVCVSSEQTTFYQDVMVLKGTCSWSVYSSMFRPEPKECYTNLIRECKRLHIEVDVISEENDFMERYLVNSDGKILIEQTEDFIDIVWDKDKYPNFQQFIDNECSCYESGTIKEEDADEEGRITLFGIPYEFAF